VLPAAKAEPQLPGTNDQQPSTATAEIGEEEAERLWQEFEKRASPEARELMLAMAASLFLTLPVLRLLLAVAAPRAFAPQPLAEVLVSGLVRRLPGQEGNAATPERLQFELVPALKRLLEPKLGPQRRRQVLAAVTDLLERHWDRQGKGTSFRALLLGPKEVLERDHPDLFHIANVTAAMLDQLPGRQFRELAAQLRGPKLVLPAPLWPASMVFNELEYQSAQLLAISEPEMLSFGTARYQDQELRPIDYETASITLVAKSKQRRKRNELTQATTSQHSPVEIHRSKATTWAFHEPLQRDALPSGATAAAADPLSLTLVEIPAGSFLMGSPPDEPQRSGDEGPQHEVQLASFFISQTPITQAQWREVALWQPLPAERWGSELNPDPSRFQNRQGKEKSDIRLFETETNTNNRPVERVSWLEAMEFCSRLSQRTGRSYTLPSEAQWEYACRAAMTTPFHFGDTISSELANYDGKYAYADGPKGIYRVQTTPVGMFPANAWGLHDMHGNVREWCLDQWHGNYNGAPTDGSAWVDYAEGEKTKESVRCRLLRGGSWYNAPAVCRSAYRSFALPGYRFYGIGFRVCCLPQD
jgi:formylglycine-generating enzyme required for sulfatase activity